MSDAPPATRLDPSLYLGDWTTDELARARADRPSIALVPIGSAEPHGPHLPLATDLLLSDEVCRRAARALTSAGHLALVAPPVGYGVTRYAHGFRGALSLRPATLIALLTDVGVALLDDGFTHVALVNNHLEPEHADAIAQACAALEVSHGAARVSFPNQLTRRWGRTLTAEYKRGDCHAGRYETSLVLAAHPALVRPEATRLPPLTISLAAAIRDAHGAPVTFAQIGMEHAYTGAPAEATAAEGETTYESLVTMVITEIGERLALRPAAEATP